MRRMIRAAWGVVTYGPFVILTIATIAFVILFKEAGDGFYRYPCQDPSMWSSPECMPPACEATGTCTDYLIERGGVTNEG
jgi:hypothetical protein